ncbi:MAG TPA: UDP-N-acetylmuramoyl-L-alanyl-D-glutamate--2,6-diaminopimelate ligase [Dongiaceae bacterium]|nr:UDP-N-acetylmuramoyl-L-alanyl-D-glutamate--2,6-diaminopimelate ligase [Dongiaceae bacterium]
MTIESGIVRRLEEFVPILKQQRGLHNSEWSDTRVNGLAVDSRKIRLGDCFIAYPGHFSDGRAFIAAAVQKGAAAVLAEADGLQVPPGVNVPVVPMSGLQSQLGAIASAFYGNPSQQLQLVAVTGTNGKTTVTQLIAHALHQLNIVSGVMGTLGNGLAGQLAPTNNTTPDIIDINRLLHEMRQHSARVVAMEASSHGLVQGRLDGLTLHTGIITNLSRDHLDYHGSMDAYRDAKALLASNATLRTLIVNADDAQVMGMAANARDGVQVMTFSLNQNSGATLVARDLDFHANGLRLQVSIDGQTAVLESPLVGEFNASNLLAALAGLLALDVSLADACRALGQVQPVAGRVEMVNPQKSVNEPAVVVDFAHTPDALEKVILSLRRHCAGKLWCVFGCGGDRDAGKRPLMGAVVARDADETIITADNPRTEKLKNIIGHIVKGIPPESAFKIIEDRTQAVEFAVLNAAGEDLILLAGKGHEDYQDVQGTKHSYSDLDVARQALQKRKQVSA